jgi:hypothetical protein
MNFAETAIQLMLQEIEKHNLELMARYPNDLLVHDRRVLEMAASPGARLAWVVGHSHTHLVFLGVHPKENEMVTYLTNLCSSDHFYVLTVDPSGCRLKEVSREDFRSLHRTPVPYTRKGTAESFTLYRKDEVVGHVVVRKVGNPIENRFDIEVVKVSDRKSDDSALHIWAEKAVVEVGHSLFVKYEMHWSQAAVVA